MPGPLYCLVSNRPASNPAINNIQGLIDIDLHKERGEKGRHTDRQTEKEGDKSDRERERERVCVRVCECVCMRVCVYYRHKKIESTVAQ